jgi:hypothetical protein
VKTVVFRLSTVEKVFKLWNLAAGCSELRNFVLEVGSDALGVDARFKSHGRPDPHSDLIWASGLSAGLLEFEKAIDPHGNYRDI